ncbi:hypothetical protein [Rhodoferax lacus]|uniref:hypothetical protein n=1 Tax=Rhodoferax lacus TaxID=2184758 RepID=UPI001F425AF3|nr:hypothetical protein [Rhodoferax lacus]
MKIALVGSPGVGLSALAAQLQSSLSPSDNYRLVDIGFSDAEPTPDAVQALASMDLVLLCTPDPDASAEHLAAYQALRTRLTQQAWAFTLLYGSADARCNSALQAIRFHARDTASLAQPPSLWRWPCEKCSDPECEHRLFSALLKPAE